MYYMKLNHELTSYPCPSLNNITQISLSSQYFIQNANIDRLTESQLMIMIQLQGLYLRRRILMEKIDFYMTKIV